MLCACRLSRFLVRASAIVVVAGAPAATADAQSQPISYVQSNFADPQTSQTTVSVAYTQPQTAASLNVVVVGWRDTTARIQSVTDTNKNAYRVAIGPTAQNGTATQTIYFANNVLAAGASANMVTVTFDQPARLPDVRIAEYHGIDPVNALDAAGGAAGVGNTSNSGTILTSNGNDLLISANYALSGTTKVGSGFTARAITSPDGDVLADRTVTSPSSYSATAAQKGRTTWVMQIVAFRGISGTPSDSQPPTAPSGLAATAASSSQINLGWTASSDNVGVTNYLVERCQGSSCTTFAQVGTATTTTYNDTGLPASTSYVYRVRATDAASNLSDYSNTAGTATLAASTIAFRQVNYSAPQSPQSSVTVPFTQAQTGGNLSVVVVGWSDATTQVQSVSDTNRNVYVRAAGPTVLDRSLSIYYAKNIAAAAANGNAVTVTFNGSAQYPDIRVAEYSGIDPVNPVDTSAASQGNGFASNSGSIATTNATDLLVAANDVETVTTAAGSGFTSRVITSPDGNILEDRVVTSTGSYSATASLSPSGNWVMQMVAFRGAGGTMSSPTISVVNPASGSVGTVVTISGTNFGATQGGSTVRFNGTLASPTSWSNTGIVAPVPAGATSGNVVVSVNGQSSNGVGFFVVSSTQVAYPLKASANGRYLVDQNNVPFLLVADTAHALSGNMSPSDAASYFANRQAHHFNSVVIYAPCGSGNHCNSSGTTYDGVAPFTTGTSPSTYDLSTPNEVYFSRLDTLLNSAASYGLNVLLDPIETGDFLTTLRNNGAAKAYNYGLYVGSRYRNFPNIIWLNGEDFQTWSTSSSDNNLVAQVMAGIAAADSNHLQTIQLNYSRSYSNQDTAVLAPYLSYDMAYTYYETYDYVLAAYNSSPTLPAFLGEANYEGENGTGQLPGPTGPGVLRRQEYWTLLSGGSGHIYGNGLVNHVASGWRENLDSPGVIQIQHSNNLFSAYQWWRLVPDQSHQILTGGYGVYSGNNANLAAANYATAAWVSDGTLAIAYTPAATTLSVDLSRFVRPVVARWYDPSNGTFQAIAGSPFNASGIHTFATPGSNADGDSDWVLVLDATVSQ